jgi:hypothetical protein
MSAHRTGCRIPLLKRTYDAYGSEAPSWLDVLIHLALERSVSSAVNRR